MAGETVITVVGNLTGDPELRYTQNGVAVASFTIASTPRSFDRASGEWKDGDALFLRASVWRDFAEHVAKSLTKGMRVIAQGRLRQRSYQDREGNNRTSYELDIDEVGPSLRYATAQVERVARGGGQGGFGGGQSNQGGGQVGGGQGGYGQQGGFGGQSAQPAGGQGGQNPGGQNRGGQPGGDAWGEPVSSGDGWNQPGVNLDDTPF
ncbi:MAG: single-stranded DNA-binding protein [Pseudoclavibacter sp.]